MTNSSSKIQDMTRDVSNVVKRLIKQRKHGIIGRHSTPASTATVGASIGGELTDEHTPYLPEECIANEASIFSIELAEQGYIYIGEMFPGFRKDDNCSLYYVRYIPTDTIYVAKVVDLHVFRIQPDNIDPCEKAEIAEHLTYYSGKNTCNRAGGTYSDEGGILSPINYDGIKVVMSRDHKDESVTTEKVEEGECSGVSISHYEQGINCKITTKAIFGTARQDVHGRENIVWQHQWFVCDDNRLVMIYENCEGGDLHDRIVKSRRMGMTFLDEVFIRNVFTQICHGVAYIHARGFVHGDIKASNVLFKKENTEYVKIGDYDTCHHVTTVHGNRLGTLMYMAPELVLDTRTTTSFESDVWALGCLLYELLTLTNPFPAPCTSVSMRNIFCDFQAQKARLVTNIPKNYSKPMHELFIRTLQLNPKCRPSVTQIISMLE